ncbi:MAG: double-strand break repair protein AddB [Bdellovibrionales bacterium]
MSKTPALYSIPAGVSFLDTLAKGLYERVGEDKDQLADMRVLLPTRRGCRGLREAFLRQTDGAPIILPRMQAIGDIDQDEISILTASNDCLEIKPAISHLHRTILLARLVGKVEGFTFSDEQAFGLADALGSFIDQIHTEGLSLDQLDQLVPENLASHWNINLQFLNILKTAWPNVLETYGLIDGGLRRRLLMEALASYWQENPPQTPVIVAGTTGSIPATANILKTVLDLPHGEVILPGLDTHLDSASWDTVTEGHPQYTIKELINTLRIDRKNIALWPDLKTAPNQHRLAFVSQLMRPADTVGQWTNATLENRALDGLIQCECDTPDEEAHTIALIMRETLEDPDQKKTAALITPDRFLGRRVEAILKRWNINIDDSAGIPLPESHIGRFMIALLDVLETKQSPITMLSLLKHPLCSAGKAKGWGNMLAKRLETDGCIRGLTPTNGLQSLIGRAKNDEIKADLTYFEELLKPLTKRLDRGLYNQTTETSYLKEFLVDLIKTLENLASPDDLWQGDAGDDMARFFSEMLELTDDIPALSFTDLKSILINQMGRIAVRPKFGTHPRLAIYGQIEARLVQADRVILGSLNEGTWPSAPTSDPWMSRPMRDDMGLPSPERAVTLAAHDFAQGISAPEIFITRSKKSGGNPTVPSRWLQRMATVCQSANLEDTRKKGLQYITWARQLNHWEGVSTPITRPAPKPPLNARPTSISVTDIEKLIKDPYEIYAKRILNLRPLDPIEEELSAKQRGDFVHKVFDRFVKKHPRTLPKNAYEELLGIGKEILADDINNPEVWASWWPRFEKMALWFIDNEKTWRAQGYQFVTGEEKATANIETFQIVGRCDRIDKDNAGNIAIIDYKTGNTYSATDMLKGFLPQLPIEGLMVEANAFETVTPADITYLGYWVVSGLKDGGKPSQVTPDTRTSVTDIMDEARNGLPKILKAFSSPDMAYISLPFAGKEPTYQDYAHFARVAEWSTGSDEAA